MKPLKEAIQEIQERLCKEYKADIILYHHVKINKVKESAEIVEAVFAAVTHGTGITKEQLISPTRKHGINDARTVAMHLIRKHTTLTLEKIGKVFGGRHYSSVLHLLQNYDNWLKTNDDFAETQQAIAKYFVAPNETKQPITGGKSSIAKAVAAA